ncbi:DUF6538 domain-containing protein [Tropicimonas sediminicola]|uniref:Site-specific recombinase XerD n=1 Tax=Tropicimonas sediminicola TaxID=1031541 RepID=A0A239M6F0_9RHOB|nr:DUF6538 domain-containing protein [Tropicimonas sediminicola]SNT38181.1 Site-specific recombinase XerD [Tropicimonas sediminicola]
MSETKSPTFTFVKEGVYYFSRRVPSDLKPQYTSPRIAFSLRTRSARVAEARARNAAGKLDDYWFHLRAQVAEIPGKHMLRRMQDGTSAITALPDSPAASEFVLLSEAVATYLRLKGQGRPVTFHRAAERACGYLIDVCGDKHLDAYTRADANRFRDDLVERGLAGSSITRVLGTVRAITNFAASELGLQFNNPFSGVYFDRSSGVSDRKTIPTETLRAVQEQCRQADDELRWLVALVSDTGMRLAEAAGLAKSDFVFDDEGNLHVSVQPHPWRRLKTKGSRRLVPLEGTARWAADRLLEQSGGSPFAFPRYNKGDTTNANSASAALNKWLKEQTQSDYTMHGFRHAMRDRLRAVECPADVVDQIGGWQSEGVGQSYGTGYPLSVLRRWLKAVA